MKTVPLLVDDVLYETQIVMRAEAQKILDDWIIGDVHENNFFKELFKRRHPTCKLNHRFPVKFKREVNRMYGDVYVKDPHHLHGYFEDTQTWEPLSWVNAVKGVSLEKNLETDIKNSFRRVYHETPIPNIKCQNPQCQNKVEDLHHISPDFDDMFKIVRPMITQDDINSNSDPNKLFDIPENSGAMFNFKELEKYSIKEYLCKKCHYTLAGKKHTSILGENHHLKGICF
jgi:hypothetical protein